MAVIRTLAALLLTVALAACSTEQSLTVAKESDKPEGFAAWTDAVPAYRIGPGDKLQVRYLFTPELDEEVLVAPDGRISLRVADAVLADGKTLPELNAGIQQAAAKWLRTPVVNASLIQATSARIYVGGQVTTPGVYRIDGRIGLMEGVLLAGGFRDTARTSEVVLIRRDPTGRPMLRTVNARQFLETAAPGDSVPLFSGDIIYVPRTTISEINLWIDQFINQVLPFQRSANFSYSIYRDQTPIP
ncbi:polysaccharide biosynthesis/export family protein [Oceanibaculum pacificum]|uniref:polysaccharide biosynthesis/export family protein n=1 Tax=Oceanibaculum pacificum TaxID=580166 RepID=UPI0012EE1402|nr:polysaccharide biosynthesis/export family protein [Oceanibaculum pacificum]